MKTNGYKVLKGKSKRNAEIDSTHTSLSRANARKNTLNDSLRNSGISVWIIPMNDGDEPNYRKKKTCGRGD